MMDVTLVMFTQSGERRDFKVRPGKKKGASDDSAGGEETSEKCRVTIGRTRGCDIQIALGIVSRRHCEVSIDEGKVQLRDLGSSNGCFVNNKRVQQSELRAGDTLTIGPVVFTVVIDENPADVKPVRTVLESKSHKGGKHGKKNKKAPKPAPVDRKSEETGSVDLDDLGLDLEADGDVGMNPLAELEELSKQKGRSR